MEQIEVLDFEEKPKKKKLKKSVKIFLMLIILVISLIIGCSFMLSSVSNDDKQISFEIKSGSSVYSVGEKLKREGFIRSIYAYKLYVKLKGINEYKAGIYTLKKSYDTKKIIDVLKDGKYNTEGIKITFKEGKNIRYVAKQIANNTNISEADFLNLLSDDEYIDSLIKKYWFLTDHIKNSDIYYPLEGYLFADTYYFAANSGVKEIIEVMLNQTDKVFSKYKSSFDKTSYSVHDIVTLASIIESEGIYKEDRKNIASVFYNRLSSNMSLGSDITTYYAFKIDLGTRDLTKVEINTYNPYNTRGPKMEGKLPVGAVSNFSEESLNAALNPNKSDYYYFVAVKSGKTHFTKTYEEHKNIIDKLKKEGNWIEW